MKKNAGFTLIELLVVVLIIGILSSIALPQYQRAVNKARGTEALVAGKALSDAQNIYFLANTQYTSDETNLDVQYPTLKYFSPYFMVGSGGAAVTVTLASKNAGPQLVYYLLRGKISSVYCQNIGTGGMCKDYFACVRNMPGGGCYIN